MPLKVVEDGGLGEAGRGMKVALSLKKVRGAEFPPGELWIEPAGNPVAPSLRSRNLEVPLGGTSWSGSTRARRTSVEHEYELEARLAGKDERQAVPARAPVSVEYEYPRLTLSDSSVTVRVPRGGSRRATVRASLHGPSGLRRPVVFRPDPTSAVEPFVEVVRRADPVMVGAAETPLDIEVKAAADAPYRTYHITGMVCDSEGGSKETPLTVIALVRRIAHRRPDRAPGGCPQADPGRALVGLVARGAGSS